MTALGSLLPELGRARNPKSSPNRFVALTRREARDIADTHRALAQAAAACGRWEQAAFHHARAAEVGG